MHSADLILAMDVGGTKTALAVIDPRAPMMIAKRAFSTDASRPPQALIADAKSTFTTMLDANGRSQNDVRGVAMAVPGPVNDEGVLLRAGKLHGWMNLPLQEDLAQAFGVPAFVEQDAKAAAIGESWCGHARGETDFVFLALGTGIGAGIVSGGRLLRGAHFGAGELGDLVMGRRHLGKGVRGEHNVDGAIGGAHLRPRIKRILDEAITPAEALVRAEADERLAAFREHTIEYVALIVVAIAAFVDPRLIVFGGGTADAGDALLDPVRERIRGDLVSELRLVRSLLGPDAQLFGVAREALDAWHGGNA